MIQPKDLAAFTAIEYAQAILNLHEIREYLAFNHLLDHMDQATQIHRALEAAQQIAPDTPLTQEQIPWAK